MVIESQIPERKRTRKLEFHMEGKRRSKKRVTSKEVLETKTRAGSSINQTKQIKTLKRYSKTTNYDPHKEKCINENQNKEKIMNSRITHKENKNDNAAKLKMLYTNADQLTAEKKEELLEKISNEKPHVVAICEMKLKNNIRQRTIEDYAITGYTMFQTNLNIVNNRRGIAIYIHSSIEKSTTEVKLNIEYEEMCLVEIKLRSNDCLLFGCFYRSPTINNTSNINNYYLNLIT